MKPLTTLFITLCITCVFAVPSKGFDKDKNEPAPLYFPSKTSKIIKKHLADKGVPPEFGEQNNLSDLFKQLIDIKTTGAFPGSLKSGAEKGHKLDSLLIERYNENTGQLEPAQLERWTWNEEGLGESWELYDLDSASGLWFANDREEYIWDEDGNKTKHTDYDPDSLKTGWKINVYTDQTYDAKGNQISWIASAKDSTTGEWYAYLNHEYTYSQFGVKLYTELEWNKLEEHWDTTEAYIIEYDSIGNMVGGEILIYGSYGAIGMKTEASYDSIGNQIEETVWWLNEDGNDFLLSHTNRYKYNGNKQQTRWTQLNWNSTDSIYEFSREYRSEYDAAGLLTAYTAYNKADSLGNPIPNYKRDYINNKLGQVTEKTYLNWNANDSTWTNNSKNNYSYNSNNEEISSEGWSWNSEQNNWILGTKHNNSIDGAGNYTLENEMTWDTTSNDWQTNYQYDYIYDLNVEFSDIVFPPQNYPYAHLSNLKNQEQFTHLMLNQLYSKQIDNQLVTTEVLNFYYSENIKTGMVDFKQAELKVFPNPATNYVIFDGIETNDKACVNLYNLQGKKLLSKDLTSENRVSVNQLKSGLYIYELTKGTETFRGKILKK